MIDNYDLTNVKTRNIMQSFTLYEILCNVMFMNILE